MFGGRVSAPAATPGCDNHTPVAPLRDGAAACEELSYYCDAPAAAYGEPYQTCADHGAKGIGNACLSVYDDCIPRCKQALDALPEGGAGGEGGAPGAGGETNAGAGGQT